MRTISGYSLVEVLVVLVIISLLAGLASVSFTAQRSHLRLNHAVRTLVSDLRWARQLAITEGQPVRIVLDAEHERYQIERSFHPGIQTGDIRDLQDRRQGYGDIDIVASSGGLEIAFQPNGTTTDWTTITLRNVKGEEKRITVVLTGRVKIRS